ncbi:hypothetical protein P7C73_g3736, partial [Tremellales sp. Uapishka_1]
MPTITLPFRSEKPLLPTQSSGMILTSPGRTARRVSYNVKSRAARYAAPLAFGGLFIMALLYFTSSSMTPLATSSSSSSSNPLRVFKSMYAKSTIPDDYHPGIYDSVEFPSRTESSQPHRPDRDMDNGISLLVQDEEELIAEDDLFWEAYTEDKPLTPEELAAEEEIATHRKDVIRHDKAHSLKALIYWMAEGGIFPNDYETPTKEYLRKVGGRGVERMLEEVGGGATFEQGWAEFAQKRYRIAVFSKTYCPYSKNAKQILNTYNLYPAPFVIELDQRSDYDVIQNLLHHLTGRRTVPNILLDFASIGGSDDITLLHAEGGLQKRFEDMDVLARKRRTGSI